MPAGATSTTDSPAIVGRGGFDALITALSAGGREVVAPTVKGGAIVLDRISGAEDLPIGWTVEQEAGRVRPARRDDQALFGYAAAANAPKSFFHAADLSLWTARRHDAGFTIEESRPAIPPRAFLGVRACDIAAIARQDRVLMGGDHASTAYADRRRDVLMVAVQCGSPSRVCFCTSFGTGPRAAAGFDLALTELDAGTGGHRFVVEIGSEAGARVMASVPHGRASVEDLALAEAVTGAAAAAIDKHLPTDGLRAGLQGAPDHPAWDAVADRCLACANCTMVCPTCFCTTVTDTTDLEGTWSERRQIWDSCFTDTFSETGGGIIRTSIKSRYRQWATHKLSTWVDQFGDFGCVGCGRCIAWCPVGIDITETAKDVLGDPRPGSPMVRS